MLRLIILAAVPLITVQVFTTSHPETNSATSRNDFAEFQIDSRVIDIPNQSTRRKIIVDLPIAVVIKTIQNLTLRFIWDTDF